VLRRLAACARTAGRRQTMFLTPPRTLITFDLRVRSLSHGVRLYRFPRLHIAFALPRRGICTIVLRDLHRKALTVMHLCR
jgi:hypothetical protein